MESEWSEITLADSLEFVVDNRGKTVPACETGIPLIATNCVSNENLYPEHINVRYITQDTFDTWFRAHPKPGDILLTNKGSKNGAVCLCPDPVGFCIAQDMVALRANREVIDPLYLFAALRSRIVQNQMKQLNVDSVIPHFKKTDFDKVHIPLPSKMEQERIGEMHFQLTYKIELNRRMNATLEGMAQALFKSWFVDFDPVIDNALAAGNPIPDKLADRAAGRKKALANGTIQQGSLDHPTLSDPKSLFPAVFQFTEELGWIPEGWNISSFDGVSNCFDRKRIPLSKKQREKRKPGTIPYYGATSVMDFIDEWIFDNTYLLIGEDGSVMKEDGSPFVQYIWSKTWVNNHAHVLQGNDGVSTEHLMLFMQAQDISPYVTGAVQLKINQKNLNSIPFLNAGNDINQCFSECITPFYERIKKLTEENETLTKLRDTLLPKLISGEVRLEESKKYIESFAAVNVITNEAVEA